MYTNHQAFKSLFGTSFLLLHRKSLIIVRNHFVLFNTFSANFPTSRIASFWARSSCLFPIITEEPTSTYWSWRKGIGGARGPQSRNTALLLPQNCPWKHSMFLVLAWSWWAPGTQLSCTFRCSQKMCQESISKHVSVFLMVSHIWVDFHAHA